MRDGEFTIFSGGMPRTPFSSDSWLPDVVVGVVVVVVVVVDVVVFGVVVVVAVVVAIDLALP